MQAKPKTQTVRVAGVPFKLSKLNRSRGGLEWRLRWYDMSNKRQTKTFRHEQDARQAAQAIRESLQAGRDLEREATGSGQMLEDHRLVLQLTKYCPRVQDLEYRLPRFREAFPDRVFQSLTGKDLDDFLGGLGLTDLPPLGAGLPEHPVQRKSLLWPALTRVSQPANVGFQ